MSAHELDHLAIAVPSWAPAGPLLHRELGARWAGGFTTPEFNPCQLAVADDMRVELLEPSGAPRSFIRRYLDGQGGAAPHHITFKVADIHAAIAGAQAAGIEPILVNLGHPAWQEAFLHPRDTGLGFLAQMVQSAEDIAGLSASLPASTGACPWEEDERPSVRLQAIHGTVADPERARHVLVDILGAGVFDPGPAAGPDAATSGATRGFRWAAGADLLLTADAGPPGIAAIGVLPADSGCPSVYPRDLPARWAAGDWHPELGLRIADLDDAVVPAASGT